MGVGAGGRHRAAGDDAGYLKGRLQEARWLLKNLEARGETLLKVVQARSEAMSAVGVNDKIAAETKLSSALNGLKITLEAYPDLKANQNFLQLQTQLKEIEDNIESARRYYNAVTRDYNTAIEQFPSNLIASQFKFERSDFFELETPDVERKAVKVSF